MIGLAVFLWPRPVKTEPIEEVYHEKVINGLFDLVVESEPLSQELLNANPKLYNFVMEHKDCLTCKAIALLALRQNDDSWADTLGEYIDDNELDSCIVKVLFDAECEKL